MEFLHLVVLWTIFWECGARTRHPDSHNYDFSLKLFKWAQNLAEMEGKYSCEKHNKTFYSGMVTKCPPNVMFVLDGSDSLDPSGFRQAQESLVREIKAVTQAFANTDIGVVLFSEELEELPLQPRTQELTEELIRQVQGLRQPRRRTSMTIALRRAREVLVDYSNSESRAYNGESSGNIIVLLSDGHPDNEQETLQEVKIAKESGIMVISLFLEPAHHSLLAHMSHNIQEIRESLNWTSFVACPARILDLVPKGSQCRDFLMVVDGSDSVLLHKETVRQFLTYTVLRYSHVTNSIGVNLYGTDSHVQAADTRIRLSSDKDDLANIIRHKLMFPTSGGTGTDRAITQSLDMLNNSSRGRESGLILVTDGPTLDPDATREAIHRSRSSGHPVIIIRVGHALNDDELNFISSGDRATVFSVDNYTQLFSVAFDDHLCDQTGSMCSKLCMTNEAPKNCRCTCDNTCPLGLSPDPERNCSCGCPNDCASGQIADPKSNCNCICSNKCPNGERPRVTDVCVCQTCSRMCPEGQTSNHKNNCNCVCSNTCPNGQPANPQNNCRCTLCNNKCPTGQSPDPDSECACICSNTCSNGRTPRIHNSCICEPVCNNICSEGSFPDVNANCACVCLNTCPGQQTPNILDDCRCVCNNSCPIGQVTLPQNNCQCQCEATCPPGQAPIPEDACRCNCMNQCPPNQTPNVNQQCACMCATSCPNAIPENNCICSQCPLSVCPRGQSQNLNTCKCECQSTCPVGQFPNPNNSCLCQCFNKCPSRQTPDPANNCRCQNSNKCPVGQILNSDNNCVLQCPNICPRGQISDQSNNCSCRCPSSCPSGQVTDLRNNCACSCPNTCPEGQSPNKDSCRCECPSRCPSGQVHDLNNNCVCSCLNTCPEGQSPNKDSCRCECPSRCPSGQVPDPNNNCACSCPNTCPEGQSPNRESCQCECKRNRCPPVTSRQNPVTCDCECLSPGLRYNSTTRSCTETSACPQICPRNSLLNADCSCQCPLGTSFDIITRLCVPLEVRGQCTGSELSCTSNQIAHRDCNDRCYCACSAGYVGSRCDIRLSPDMCNNCSYNNGHYHAGVAGHCDLYVMCVPDGRWKNKTRPISFVPYFMSCPPGHFTSQDLTDGEVVITRIMDNVKAIVPTTVYEITISNDRRNLVTTEFIVHDREEVCVAYRFCARLSCQRYQVCSLVEPSGYIFRDPLSQYRCGTLPPDTPYEDASACQSYWQCGSDRRLASKECCPAGQRFDPSSSRCVSDSSCPITCGPNRTHDCTGDYNRNTNGCPYDINPYNPNQFFYRSLPGYSFRCQPTYIMNLEVCHCITGSNSRPFACEATVDMNFEDNPMNSEDSVPRIPDRDGHAANFRGFDDIVLKVFAGSGFWTEYFQINLRMMLSSPVPRGQRMAVVTNADCDTQESVSITVDDTSFYFKVFQLNTRQAAEITIPHSGRADQDGWFSVALMYRRENPGFQFSGTVGRDTQVYSGNVVTNSYIDVRTCALHLGQGFRYAGLVAKVDNFQVWRCDPRLGTLGQSG